MHQALADLPASTSITDVRFSTRTLLFLMVLVAIVATTGGQCTRHLDPRQQIQAASVWALWATLVTVVTMLIGRKRYLVERAAGSTILRLPVYGMNPYWRVVGRYLFSGYLLLIGPLMLITTAGRAAACNSTAAALKEAFAPDVVFMAWLTSTCITLWWWPSDIRVCTDGVLWDRRFIRWGDAQAKWDPDRDAVALYGPDQNGIELRCDAVVPEQQRSRVETLLEEKRCQTPSTVHVPVADAPSS